MNERRDKLSWPQSTRRYSTPEVSNVKHSVFHTTIKVLIFIVWESLCLNDSLEKSCTCMSVDSSKSVRHLIKCCNRNAVQRPGLEEITSVLETTKWEIMARTRNEDNLDEDALTPLEKRVHCSPTFESRQMRMQYRRCDVSSRLIVSTELNDTHAMLFIYCLVSTNR